MGDRKATRLDRKKKHEKKTWPMCFGANDSPSVNPRFLSCEILVICISFTTMALYVKLVQRGAQLLAI